MTAAAMIEYLKQQPANAEILVWSWIIEQDCQISHILHLPERGTIQIYTDEDDL
jgi:hypothetical protein